MPIYSHSPAVKTLPEHWKNKLKELTENLDSCAEILSIHLLPASQQSSPQLQIILFELSLSWLHHQREWCQKHRTDTCFRVDLMTYTDFVDWLQRNPLSLLQLQQTGQVMYGDNLFESQVILPENLRQELEKKMSQERLWFRERFLHSPSNALGNLLSEARQRFRLLEQGLIFLRSQSTRLPLHWLDSLYGLVSPPQQRQTIGELQTDLEQCWEWELFLSHIQQKLSQMFESGDRDIQGLLTL